MTRVVTSPDPSIARRYHSRKARREAYERRFEAPRSTIVYLAPAYPDPPYVYRTRIWNELSGVDPAVYRYPYAPRHLWRDHRGFRGFHHDRHFGRRRHHRDPVIHVPTARSFSEGFTTRGGAYRRR